MLDSNLPHIRIVVTCKNAERTIGYCLQSILDLDYPSLNITVIDGGSTDGTNEIVETFHNVELVRGKFTRSQAYNYALRNYYEEIFGLVDADCVVHPEWAKTLIKDLSSENIAAAGGFFTTPEDGNWISKLIGLEFFERTRRFGEFVPRLNTGNLMFRRSAALEVGGFDEDVKANQDMIFGYKLTEKGYRIKFDPKANIEHYHRSSFKKYFLQQFSYALDMPTVYSKYPKYIKGDHLTSLLMNLQPIILACTVIFALVSLAQPIFFWGTLCFLGILLAIYFGETLRILIQSKDFKALQLPIIYVVRNIAWTLGGTAYVFRCMWRIRR